MRKINNEAMFQQIVLRVWGVLFVVFFLPVMDVFGQTHIDDLPLNRIETIFYDRDGAIVSQMKEYFGLAGEPLQTQRKNVSRNEVLATTIVRDANGRPVMTTLPAPIGDWRFHYKDLFFVNETNAKFGYSDFGAPGKVGHSVRGTLGWYYGSENNMERNVPVSDFPYSQIDYYNDGTEGVRFQAQAGESHRIGNGRDTERASRTFLAKEELGNYYAIQLAIFPDYPIYENKAIVRVTRDENRQYSISIVDTRGNTLMTALAGTPDDYDLKLLRSHSVTSSPTRRLTRDFYLFNPQDVQVMLSGGGNIPSPYFTLRDLLSIDHSSGPERRGGLNYFSDGFFKVNWQPGFNWYDAQFTSSLYLKDIAYYFYDAYGRIVAEMPPNSVRQILKENKSIVEAAKITYNYNFKGWLLSMMDPDKGQIQYKYRKDGRLRFSQRADQVSAGYFAYTHYDRLGRPIESGECTDATYSFASLDAQLEYIDQVYFLRNNTRDWLKTAYDLSDLRPTVGLHAITHLPKAAYTQTNMRGAVSYTENVNVTTWYSYDEYGRVLWMIQKPKDVSFSFVVKYSYDFLGNVLQVSNLTYSAAGELQEEFYHHYTYDTDKRLDKVYTSEQVAGPRKLRATYEYYLHGPLKRIELGSKTQGVDFVYNIQGWLTQINHPDPLQDPGHDGNDAFGMVLDYYKSDMNNLFPTAAVPDPYRGHNVPEQHRLAVNHPPLIRFIPESPPLENSASPFLKDFGTGGDRYKDTLHSLIVPSNK
ncbi:RHS repeat domain-containing protein [Dawidia soli]|uniref:Uncharacterized protein n=1 Tax=Dawidia soli TaxID=2782352 RepID=A0AAP2D7L2_9BACT|nr:hypothetical protein [Dawidia soli]MBT1686911.1 hypothetical protein [Dawidia soli]